MSPLRSKLIAVLAPLAVVALGCQSAPEEDTTPTEPWRVDEAPQAPGKVRRRLLLVVAEGSEVAFEIKGRERSLAGTVPVVGGRLEVDPEALEHTRGELVFALDRLEVRGEEGSVLREETSAARRALGLGKEVEPSARARAARATFRVLHGRQLSSRAAHRGSLVASGGESGQVRRVTATAEGELSIRGIEVHHSVRLQLDFVYDGKPGADVMPKELHCSLSNAERVSLAEHEILPRDGGGRVVAVELEAFRKGLAKSLSVTGQVVLRSEPTRSGKSN